MLLVLGAMSQWPVGAQTNVTRAPSRSERYLLVVETTKSMQRRTDEVLGLVQEMLTTGLNGQFRDGGTLGVWTFNEELSAGKLPMQVWSAADQKNITQRTLKFLKEQKYEKQANFDKLAPALSRVVSDSRRLTLILISSGDWKLRGTPYDQRINDYFQQWRDQQQKAHMPFVTILCATNGQYSAFAVNTPPWPMQLPQFAEEPKRAEPVPAPLVEMRRAPVTSTVPPLIVVGKKPQSEPAPTPKPELVAIPSQAPSAVATVAVANQAAVVKPAEPAVSSVPPLIVIGKKSQPEPVPTPKPELVAAQPETLPAAAAAAVVNQPAPVKSSNPVIPAAQALIAQLAPVMTEKPAAELQAKATPAPIPASQPKREVVKVAEPKAVEPAPLKIADAPPPAAPAPKPAPVIVEPPKAAKAPEVKPPLAPVPAAVAEVAPAAAPRAVTTEAAPASHSSVAPPPAERTASPVQSATAVPAESLTRYSTLLIAGAVVAVIVLLLAIVLMRHSRSTPQASLITRSFEREKRP